MTTIEVNEALAVFERTGRDLVGADEHKIEQVRPALLDAFRALIGDEGRGRDDRS